MLFAFTSTRVFALENVNYYDRLSDFLFWPYGPLAELSKSHSAESVNLLNKSKIDAVKKANKIVASLLLN